ncbi:MAG: ribosome-binding factor A, partial [Chitinivibrionales bacterium]
VEGKEEAITGLNKASPFIQKCIIPRIRIKNIPRLHFIYDDTFARAEKIDSILEQIDDEKG